MDDSRLKMVIAGQCTFLLNKTNGIELRVHKTAKHQIGSFHCYPSLEFQTTHIRIAIFVMEVNIIL